MTRILTLIATAAALSLSSCTSMKKDSCDTCCATPAKEKACCTAAHAKGAKCDVCEKGHKH